MKTLVRVSVILLVVVAGSAGAYTAGMEYWKKRNQTQWRLADVTHGRLVSMVNATGKIQPVRSITVGSFVSGPIDTKVPLANFNQEVQKGELLCRIDPTIYKANLDRDLANLASREADLVRSDALLRQGERDLDRAIKLREEDKAFIAQAEMDKFYFTVLTARAQVALADAGIKVAQSTLQFSQAQLNYCEIMAPESGIIINRKIEPGQTLAAQFTAPELFVIAPNMRERVDVFASVDEADIGHIRRAQQNSLPVTFTVDAYTEELFEGRVEEVRMNSTTTQNVVTYPVIVAAPNPDLKLLPGMTASLSFEVDERADVVKIPNAALRFFPLSRNVRTEDRHLVEGTNAATDADADEQSKQSERSLSAPERSDLRKKRNRRHVWVAEGEFLKAVEVETGLSDSHYTELVKGDLKPGDKLVSGIVPPVGFGGVR